MGSPSVFGDEIPPPRVRSQFLHLARVVFVILQPSQFACFGEMSEHIVISLWVVIAGSHYAGTVCCLRRKGLVRVG